MILDANKTKKRNAQMPLNSSDVFDDNSKKALDKALKDMKNTLDDIIALSSEFDNGGDCTIEASAINTLIETEKPIVQVVAEGAIFSPLYLLVQATDENVYAITFALAEPDETNGYAVSEYVASGIEYPASEDVTFTKTTL